MVYAFSGLSLEDRPTLFNEIRSVRVGGISNIEQCRFGDSSGWLISDMDTAFDVLTSGVGIKSRPRASQRLLGGVGSMQGDHVRDAKRQLIIAIGIQSRNLVAVENHLRAAMSHSNDHQSPGNITEALSAATVTQLTGAEPGAVDGRMLRELVFETWRTIERGDPHSTAEDSLTSFLYNLVKYSDSEFVSSLRRGEWTDSRISDEIRAMLLAGWGSTTASILSSISLGVASNLFSERVLDEVLRLYPPSFMIGRTVVDRAKDLPLSLGDTVVISPWLIHRNPRAWEAANEFQPGRARLTNGRPWFLPFGVGPRRCPAASLARRQAAVGGRLLDRLAWPSGSRLSMVEDRSPVLLPC